MKNIKVLIICLLISTIFFGWLTTSVIVRNDADVYNKLTLPAGFPSQRGLIYIWTFLLTLAGIGSWFVFTTDIPIRRKRNIFLDAIILGGAIYAWNLLLFQYGTPEAVMGMAIGEFLLGIVVWFMYLLVNRFGGYLLTPLVFWIAYSLYLSIALVVKN